MGDLTLNASKLLNVGEADLDAILKRFQVDRKILKECTDTLMEWYKTQEHLPQGALDDRMILSFLIRNKFLMERCKDAIDDYFTIRSRLLEFADNWDVKSPLLQEVFEIAEWFILPKKTSNDQRVIITRMTRKPQKKERSYTFKEWAVVSYMVSDFISRNDLSAGEQIIYDFTDVVVKPSEIAQATPTFFSKMFNFGNKGFAMRIKTCHIVNIPDAADFFLTIIKAVMPEKYASRIKTYKTMDDMKKTFEVDLLPSDLGGKERHSDELVADLKATLSSPQWQRWFLDQTKIRCDESKRKKPNPNAPDPMFGATGSFKTLSID